MKTIEMSPFRSIKYDNAFIAVTMVVLCGIRIQYGASDLHF